MNKLIKFIVPCLLLFCGATLVVVGDKYGWFTGGTSEAQVCPHGLTTSTCAFCDPTLIESLGFCGAHGVPEAFCTRCNEKLIVAFQSINDWCAEHRLPESQCTICNPELSNVTLATTPADAIKIVSNHFLRNQQAPSLTCTNESLLVQFLSPQTVKKAGLEYEAAIERAVTETITCNAEVTYNQNQFAHISARTPGIINQVHRDLGDAVQTGDLLVTIDSSELAMAKANLLQAQAHVNLWQKNVAREQYLLRKNASTEREVLEAETELTEHQIQESQTSQRLTSLGLDHAAVELVLANNDTSSLLAIRAPFDGIIVERDAVVGEVIDSAQPLLAIADTSHMWAKLDLAETDIAKVKLGQSVNVRFGRQTGENFQGKTTWISSQLDPKSRTVQARIEIPNPDNLLRSGMFGKAHITVKDNNASLTIPKSAVQWEGCCNVVFVRRSDYVFEPRKISITYEADTYYAVTGNIQANETVVTTGSFLLKTEILKGSIGAGCCEVEPGR